VNENLDPMTFICGSLEIYRMCENGLFMSMLLKVIVITVCECMYVVSRGHFWSRDKDGGHTTGSAVSENPMLHANLMALSFIEPELWVTEVYITRIGIFNLFAFVTLTLTQ